MPPKHWKVLPLGRLGIFSKGAGISKADMVPKGYPAIRYGELYTSHHVVIRDIFSFIDKAHSANSKRIHSGDILFAGSGETSEEIGKCAVFIDDFEAYAGGDVIIFSPKNADPVYLAYALNSSYCRRFMMAHAQGHSVVHIYARDLKKMPVLLPPLPEQRKIVALLQLQANEIRLLKGEVGLLENRQRGLRQAILSGNVRPPK